MNLPYVLFWHLMIIKSRHHIWGERCGGGGLRRGSGMLPDTPAVVSVMAAADNALIPSQPFEESQCSTAGPGTCAITIKRYHRHSSMRAR